MTTAGKKIIAGLTEALAYARGEDVPVRVTHYQYVVHALVPAYEALGWTNTGDLRGTHHGHHADLLKWDGPGEPKEPARV